MWSAIDRTVEWAQVWRRRKSIAIDGCQKYVRDAVKIVNKRPRNLLNEIQNVFVNGNQVKTLKVKKLKLKLKVNSEILPILRQNNDRQLNAHMYMRQQWPLHGDGQFATSDHGALRLQPTNCVVKLGRTVGRRYKHVLTQPGVFYASVARLLKPTHDQFLIFLKINGLIDWTEFNVSTNTV